MWCRGGEGKKKKKEREKTTKRKINKNHTNKAWKKKKPHQEGVERKIRKNMEENTAAKRLKSLREFLGLSPNAFGAKIGYTGKHIGRYEKGITKIPDEVIKKITEAFNVDSGYFEGTVPVEEAVEKIDKEKEKKEIAARIAERRNELCLSRRALSRLCETNENQISMIETQKITVTESMARKIGEALDVGVDWILKGDESRKNYPEDGELREWLWEHEDVRKELWERMKNE